MSMGGSKGQIAHEGDDNVETQLGESRPWAFVRVADNVWFSVGIDYDTLYDQ